MTNEEREALVARACATVHPTSDDTGERQTRALLSALDEARGQLAALHAVAKRVNDAPEPGEYEGGCDGDCSPVGHTDACNERMSASVGLHAALSDTAAAAKAHEVRVREPVERERDAAIVRAEAAERDLHALRAGVAVGRATMERLASEHDTLAAALAEVREKAQRLLDTPFNDDSPEAASDALTEALAALPVDLAAQRDARMVRRGIERAIERWRIDTATDDEIGALADEAEKGGAEAAKRVPEARFLCGICGTWSAYPGRCACAEKGGDRG